MKMFRFNQSVSCMNICYFIKTCPCYIFVVLFQDDDEGHLAVFQCIQDMMSKGPNIFLIHFIRLGVLQKISEMANQFEAADQDVLIDGKIIDKVINCFCRYQLFI